METKRRIVEDLLGGERRQPTRAVWGGGGRDASRLPLNAVWRRKVIRWYFTLIAAMRRQLSAAAAESRSIDDSKPFSRVSVHVAVSLLDNYLASLPSERVLRYVRDRLAYQLLATTCLLVGMHLARHERTKESRQREAAGDQRDRGGEVPRGHHWIKRGGTAVPDAAFLLRVSGAPKSITEQRVSSMAREIMGAPSFPRSKVITALDFVRAFDAAGCTSSTYVGRGVSLGPVELGVAFKLVDASLMDVIFLDCRPSVVACAAISLSLARSRGGNLNMPSLRRQVHRSMFGDEDDPALSVAVRMAESSLLTAIQVVAPSLGNELQRVAHTTDLIPPENSL